jgi:hypothetical protein
MHQAAQFVEALELRGFGDHELVTVNGNRAAAARKGPANAIELSIELTAPPNHRAIWSSCGFAANTVALFCAAMCHRAFGHRARPVPSATYASP